VLGLSVLCMCMDFVLMWNKKSVPFKVSIIQDTLSFINGLHIYGNYLGISGYKKE